MHAVVRCNLQYMPAHELMPDVGTPPPPPPPLFTGLTAVQSLFIGRRQPLVQDGAPVLYPRYRDLSEILLVRLGIHAVAGSQLTHHGLCSLAELT